MAAASSEKLKCKYGSKCYGKDKAHQEEYSHASDSSTETVAKDVKTEETKQNCGTKSEPLSEQNEDFCVQFAECTLERKGTIYSCTCDEWKKQSEEEKARTCKHLKEYLGEDFEKRRVEKADIPQKIEVSVLLAHEYDEKIHNPVGWWISEKLDGYRALWNGKCFYSRLGNAFYAPAWFTADLPEEMHLDGELFGGRGEFQSTSSIINSQNTENWKKLKYHVFDTPSLEKKTFEERVLAIKEYFDAKKPKYAVSVEHTKCTDKKQLDEKLKEVLDHGGEGLMIRQPKSLYEKCRSHTLLKIKKFYAAEAVVIGYNNGKGRNEFVCSLRCRMASEVEFSVSSGLTNEDKKNPPKKGSIITYKFQELFKSGKPRFPVYLGIRTDMTEPKDAEIRSVSDD